MLIVEEDAEDYQREVVVVCQTVGEGQGGVVLEAEYYRRRGPICTKNKPNRLNLIVYTNRNYVYLVYQLKSDKVPYF